MGLALELRARGHDVLIVTSEFYRAKIEGVGLAFRPLRPQLSPDDPQIVARVMRSPRGPEVLIRDLMLPHLREMYSDLLEATAGADYLICGEVVMAAPLVAEKRGLRWAAAILAPFSFFSIHDPVIVPILPFGAALARAPAPAQRFALAIAKRLTAHWLEPIRALRRELGLRPHVQPLLWDRFSPSLNLALFGPDLGTPQSDWPRNTRQTGFVFYDEPAEAVRGESARGDPQLEAFLAAGEPPIVFTLGSAAVLAAGDFFEEAARAARQLGRRALLIMGENPAPTAPTDGLFAIDYAPYSQVFSKAAVVVHQGGAGTTGQALRAGVPQLIVPYGFDQPDNAARIVRAGIGLTLSRKRLRAERIAAALRNLLDNAGYAERARLAAGRLAASRGAVLACDAIEQDMETTAARDPRSA